MKMERRRIVVMGGSFNPPTIAHLAVMQKALDAVHACKGFLVPVSFPYLKRKMMRAGHSHLCLSDELRLRMLREMIQSDDRIEIDTREMKETFAITVMTMGRIQQEYPDAKIYFVAGADKLDLLEEFRKRGTFFEKYGVILFSRSGEQLMKDIEKHELLRDCLDSIVLTDLPAEMENVSSTKIREHLFDIDAAADMLHPAVLPILRELKEEDYPKEILGFRDEYAFLSNDDPSAVLYEGICYPCAASAFLASRYEDAAQRKRIAGMSHEKAKQKYTASSGNSSWQNRQLAVMEEIVRLKFEQHPERKRWLLETGRRLLIHAAKQDKYWGVNLITWEGENHLGEILMKIRDEMKENKSK